MYECYLGDSCKETLATRTMGNTGIAGSELAESTTEMMQMFGTEAETIDQRLPSVHQCLLMAACMHFRFLFANSSTYGLERG